MSAVRLVDNDSDLSLSLERLRLLLQRAADRRTAPGAPPSVEQRRSWWRGRSNEPRPPLLALEPPAPTSDETSRPALLESMRRTLGLSDFELDTLLLCAAPDLDTGFGQLLQSIYGQSRPSFAVAMDALPNPSWDIRSPERPLRFWRLVDGADGSISNTTPLRVDERILHAIKGLDHLDARLSQWMDVVHSDADVLPPSQQAVCDEAVDLIARAAAAGEIPLVQLIGPFAQDRTTVAASVVEALGMRLYCLRTSNLTTVPMAELAELARIWHRETLLAPVALLLDDDGADESASARGVRNAFVRRGGGLMLAAAPDVLPDLPVQTLSLEVGRPTAGEQRDLWVAALGSAERADASVLGEQFRLDGREIRRIVARTALPAQPQEATRALQAATRRALRPRLEKLATWVRPVATWDTLVLPDAELQQLHQIAEQVKNRSKVYSRWGFGTQMNRGLGINALFAGESGTGKTMAAEVLANELGLDLYRIDLAGVVDKYVGETPKHLRTVFDWGEAGEAILAFEEADAVCGKRSEVKDAHDRYANIEIDYLLQRMENYRGIAILTTNMRDALDRAFLRRLRFVINFPLPTAPHRELMWRNAFPAETPVGELDYPRLGRIALTGAGVTEAAVASAFRAAAAGGRVEMADVLDAARAVLRKHDRPINEADFRIDRQEVPA
jgi:ATPase family associated with various cellular activities (AAA)